MDNAAAQKAADKAAEIVATRLAAAAVQAFQKHQDSLQGVDKKTLPVQPVAAVKPRVEEVSCISREGSFLSKPLPPGVDLLITTVPARFPSIEQRRPSFYVRPRTPIRFLDANVIEIVDSDDEESNLPGSYKWRNITRPPPSYCSYICNDCHALFVRNMSHRCIKLEPITLVVPARTEVVPPPKLEAGTITIRPLSKPTQSIDVVAPQISSLHMIHPIFKILKAAKVRRKNKSVRVVEKTARKVGRPKSKPAPAAAKRAPKSAGAAQSVRQKSKLLPAAAKKTPKSKPAISAAKKAPIKLVRPKLKQAATKTAFNTKSVPSGSKSVRNAAKTAQKPVKPIPVGSKPVPSNAKHAPNQSEQSNSKPVPSATKTATKRVEPVASCSKLVPSATKTPPKPVEPVASCSKLVPSATKTAPKPVEPVASCSKLAPSATKTAPKPVASCSKLAPSATKTAPKPVEPVASCSKLVPSATKTAPKPVEPVASCSKLVPSATPMHSVRSNSVPVPAASVPSMRPISNPIPIQASSNAGIAGPSNRVVILEDIHIALNEMLPMEVVQDEPAPKIPKRVNWNPKVFLLRDRRAQRLLEPLRPVPAPVQPEPMPGSSVEPYSWPPKRPSIKLTIRPGVKRQVGGAFCKNKYAFHRIDPTQISVCEPDSSST